MRRRTFLRDDSGQTATEYMLIISVIVVAVVAAAYVFIPQFQKGVADLADDVSTILANGRIGGAGIDRGTMTTNSAGPTLACDDPRLGAMYDPPPCF